MDKVKINQAQLHIRNQLLKLKIKTILNQQIPTTITLKIYQLLLTLPLIKTTILLMTILI